MNQFVNRNWLPAREIVRTARDLLQAQGDSDPFDIGTNELNRKRCRCVTYMLVFELLSRWFTNKSVFFSGHRRFFLPSNYTIALERKQK